MFDRAKLDWVNAHFIKQLSNAEIAHKVNELYQVELSGLLKNPAGEKLFNALKERAVRLSDFVSGAKFFTSDVVEKDPTSVETVLKVAKPEAMPALAALLEALPDGDWTAEKIAPLFKEAAAKIGGKMPDVAKPARVLLTGSLASPDIGLVVEVLGKERALKRLRSN